MAGLSIFAKRAYLNTSPNEEFEFTGIKPANGYLKRVSSIIRADQIASITKAKLNPQKGYKKDICIYVKPELDSSGNFAFTGKSNYLDVIDELGYINLLKKHPEVGAIALSQRDVITLATEGLTNKIILIPQHHCNFERIQRVRTSIKTIGIIGNHKAFSYLPPDLKPRLKDLGLELYEFSNFFTRKDILDFYKNIDLQIVWRPYRKKLANPLKIVNAASFGIPTIALEESYFKEVGNAYIGVRDLNHFFVELSLLLKYPTRYKAYEKLCQEIAENYHIDHIAKRYLDLV